MKQLKKYKVRYAFSWGGTIVVESTNKSSAQAQAQEVLKKIITKVRPYSAKTYTDVENLPNDAVIENTRSYDPLNAYWTLEEPFDSTTPTKIY